MVVRGVVQRGVPAAPGEKAASAKLRVPAKITKVYPEQGIHGVLSCFRVLLLEGRRCAFTEAFLARRLCAGSGEFKAARPFPFHRVLEQLPCVGTPRCRQSVGQKGRLAEL